MKPTINLHENESLLFECQPKKSLIGYLYLKRAGRFLLILPVVLFVLYRILFGSTMSASESLLASTFMWVFLGFVLINILAIAWLNFVMNRYWYFFTNARCIIYTGYWGINRETIPYNRIVDLHLNRSPLRMLFGISALYITQQGLASGYSPNVRYGSGVGPNMAIIDGLSPEKANKIADLLGQQISTR